MPDITQEVTFESGGLNWDDDKRYFAKGDAEYRLNVIPNQSGNTFSLTNLKGNTEYSHSFIHDSAYDGAEYTVIGDCYDDNRDAIYLGVYSTLGNDSILRFNFADNSFDKIAWDHTDLGFDINYPLTDMFMIGDWLHWNPRTTSPRSINVQWAYYDFIAYNLIEEEQRLAGDYVVFYNKVYLVLEDTYAVYPPTQPDIFEFVDFCYRDSFTRNADDLDSSVTPGEYFRYRSFYNTPTVIASKPTTLVATDTDYVYNNIRGRRFQFCYRHYIKDQGYTISSQYTDIIAAPSSENNKGEITADIQANNLIQVKFPVIVGEGHGTLGLFYSYDVLFEFVEVLFREGPDDVWKIADRVSNEVVVYDFSSTGLYTINFYNDRSYEVADTDAVETQYNALPITSRSQWSLDGNRSVYGGNVEGYNGLVNIDVDLTVGKTAITLDEGSGVASDTYEITGTWDDDIHKWFYESEAITIPTLISIGDVLGVEVGGEQWQTSVTADDIVDDEAYGEAMVRLFLLAGINASSTTGTVYVSFMSSTVPYEDSSIWLISLYGTTAVSSSSYKSGSFKNGAWHPFCLFYYDDILRKSEPVFNDAMRVYVDTLAEEVPAGGINYQRYITWNIDHEPPAWAKYWRWGYAGNQTIDKFWQYNLAEVATGETRGGISGSETWTRLDISPLQNIMNSESATNQLYFPNSVIELYSYEAGDRVRFITTDVSKPSNYAGLVVADTNEDYEILEFDDENNYIYIEDITAITNDPETIIVEIYRPKQQSGTTIYYEYGDLYSTYEDSGVLYHRGSTVDQTSSVAAQGKMTNGDVYVITRLFSLIPFTVYYNPVFVESYGWSDFRSTVGWGKGKASAFTGIGQQYVNHARYSNKYEPDSQSSGLSTFDGLDYLPLGNDHGKITAMRQAGNTLKLYFERNSASVLVNKTQFYSSDGVSQVLKSDDVLGDIAYSNYHYGTIFPESVYMKDRTVFFYDIYRSAFVQDDSNGLSVISNNKMSRYFDEKSTALLESGVGNIKVYTTYDYVRDLLVVLFNDGYSYENNECIIYGGGRWLEFASWNKPIFYSGELLTYSLPEDTSTSPIMEMSGTFYGVYQYSIEAQSTGTFSDTADFALSGSIDMRYGDQIAVYLDVGSYDASMLDLVSMVVTGTGGVTSDVIAFSDWLTDGDAYTYTATGVGTLQVGFRVSGTSSVTSGDSIAFQWLPYYTRNVLPTMGRVLSNFCSYVDEGVWIHHTNATYNNFWGEQYTSIVEVIGNEAANMKKTYEAMAIHSNKEWDVTEIVIPADETYVNGMESKLPKSRFTKREGAFYSAYLRNQLTNSSTASAIDLVRGEELRGYFIQHRLENVDTVEVVLFKVDVSGNVSLV